MGVAGGAPFAIERRDSVLEVRGQLQLADGSRIWREMHRAAEGAAGVLDIDISGVESLDGAAVALLVDLRSRLADHGVKCELVGASDQVEQLVALYQGYMPPASRPRWRHLVFVEHLGEAIGALAHSLHVTVEFVGEVVRGVANAVAFPIRHKRREVFQLVVRAGTDAMPLVVLLNFLIGFVMGYDASRQLAKYGADVYIADVVGVAVTRELSPVMTSIIVLGRSAAAYAAELGTMKVSEELDALHTLGFSPIRQLVIPRVVALLIVNPLLTLIGDVAGVLGGALVGVTSLDVNARAYLAELRDVVVVGDVLGGLLKASVTGLTIAMIGCQQGLATQGGPAGVGARATATVVKSLVALVLIDAFFAVFLGALRS